MAKREQLTREQNWEVEKSRMEKQASFWYDIAKIVFGGMVVTVFQQLVAHDKIEMGSIGVALIGIVLTTLCCIVAKQTFNLNNK